MALDNWRQAETLFHQVVGLDPAEREARLAGVEEEVRAEVISLVAAFEAGTDLEPLHPVGRGAKAELATVGPYALERELGEGGMGTVYLATRADQQFEMKVAIKVIRAGPGSKALIDRFYRERQILAGMEHPNIARLLDGGLTEDGRPYLVMDYVAGTRLDAHCDERRLGVRARLEIFRKICEAVTYAHQHLVIHRDLKPSNIMVTPEGEPKLLDFGIATVVRSQTEATELTMTAGLFLTPLYASPELVRGARISVSSDVYSLGVILYELLCGRSPYDPFTLSPANLIHAITTADPNFPSSPGRSAETDSESPEAIAELRGETPGSLAAKLRGDLDSIVLKALAKSTAERYGSVEQFSDDIGRYLAGEPVLAVKAGAVYRIGKFLRRHKAGVAAGAGSVALLLAGVAGTTWQARVAEARFNETRQLAKYLLFDLYTSVQKLPGSTPVRAEMAQRSLGYLDRLSASKGRDKELQSELAEGYLRAGNVLGNPFEANLGKREEAMASYRKALALVEPVGNDRRAQLTRARVWMQIGGLETFTTVKENDGVPRARQAVAEFDRLLAETPGDEELAIETASAHQTLGRHMGQSGGWIASGGTGAQAEILRAREILRKLPGTARVLRILTVNYQTSAMNQSMGDPQAALRDYEAALGALAAIPGPEKEDREVRRLRAGVLMNRGWDLGQTGQYAAAIADFVAAAEILEGISAGDPLNAAALYQTTTPYRNTGIVQGYAGNKPAAAAAFRRLDSIYARLMAMEPGNALHAVYRAEAQVRLGDLLATTVEGQWAAQEGIAFMVKLAEKPGASDGQLLDAARWLLTTQVTALRDPRKALGFARRTGKDNLMTDEFIAMALFQTGDAAGAVAAIDQALARTAAPKAGEKPSRRWAGLQEEREKYLKASKK
ncbi:MAG: serine/threonine-protein kinase [Acidobacteria bacterium]|nr:serine/threonine-protein kinase [Acidobacteriota bacterium]